MTVGAHTVTVFTDPLAGAWSAPIASNAYMTSDATGWAAGVFSPALVWNADGSVTSPSAVARDPAYPVPRTPASAYRMRLVVTIPTAGALTWGLYYGRTPDAAWKGPFWEPANAASQTQWGGFQAGTYTLETTVDPSTIDPAFIYLGPVVYSWGDAAPAITVSTLELTQRLSPGIDLSCLVDSITINHGRDDSASQPEASSVTVDFTATPTDPLPAEVDVGAVLEVTTAVGDGASSQRFLGRITDVTLGWDEAGAATPDSGVGQVLATSYLADLGRRVVGDVPWPVELDGARVARALAAAGVTLDASTSDPGTVSLLARDIDATPALDAARQAAIDGNGVLWATRGGEIRYADAEHRRGTRSALTLDACDVLVTPTWRRTTEGLINEVSVGYGVAPEGGEQPRFVETAPSSVSKWGRYGYTTATALAALADAQAMGRLLLARNSSPVWVMAALPVDVAGLDEDRTLALLNLEMHSLLTLTGLPSLGTAPTSATLWVEGWRETLAYGSHDIELVVSGYCRTAPPPRWDDLSPSWLWGGTTLVVQRRNTMRNPAVTSNGTDWSHVVQAAGTATGTRQTGGTLTLPTGQTVGTYWRQEWATIATGALANTGVIFGNSLADAMMLTPGVPNTVSVYVRGNVAGRVVGLVVTSHKSDGSNQVIEFEGRTADPHTLTSAWQRLSATFTPAAGQVRCYVRIYNHAGPLLTVGERMDATAALCEAAATLGAYFDGDTPDASPLDYAWTGAVGASQSVAQTVATIAGGLPPTLTWDDAACLGPPSNLGRWNDQPATLRWDQLANTITWDTYPSA